MSFKIVLICLLGQLFSHEITYSQEWGEISDKVLQMTQFELDPEADAVIIFNIGKLRITPNREWQLTQHKRIKILTEAGKKYATIKIPYWHEDQISNLEAVCYHPDGEEFEIESDDIFDKGSERWKQKVFAIPAVEDGSVIEYSYELFSKNIHRLEPWNLQGENYTILSRYSVIIPKEFDHDVITMNLNPENLEINQEEVFAMGIGGPLKRSKFSWTMQDVPGIKEEPYMTAFKDYFAQILFQVRSYDARFVHHNFTKEWEEIAKTISNRYDPLFNQTGSIKNFVMDLLTNIKDPELRAKTVYEYVKSEIQSTKNDDIFESNLKEPNDVFMTKTGSITEKNLLLISMLRHAGLEAHPLLISTRENGIIQPEWVQLQQFDRVLAYMKIKDTSWYLDTANKYYPFGYLTPSSDVTMGLLIQGDQGLFTLLQSQEIDSDTKIKTDAEVINQGDIVAKTEIIYEGYNAVRERNLIAEGKVKAYFTEKLKAVYKKAILDTFTISNQDSLAKPLIFTLNYRLPGYIQIIDKLQNFKPPYFTSLDKNPFRRQTRNFPVDYSYLHTETETIKLHLPVGLTLSEVPVGLEKDMKQIIYNKIYVSKDDGIECRRSFGVTEKRVEQFKYKDLRLLYDDIVESDQTQIVLIQNKPN